MSELKIGVLVSGGGTNLEAIIESCEKGKIPARVVLVISNKEDAYALTRARNHDIEGMFLSPRDFKTREEYWEKMRDILEERKIGLICLAGFLLKLSPLIVKKFRGRIMNIHPALLPEFGGDGMYGRRVHEAVLESGAKFSGCTVHFVDEVYDAGPIILQKKVPVLSNDTPDTLAERVLKEEHKTYSEAIKLFAERKLEIKGKRVIIK